MDYVPTNTHSSQGESQLYIFEDNEAVIKMIIKGQSSTMRHVSTFVPVSWMCKKQASVSLNPTESEVIALDAGLRMVYPLSISGIWLLTYCILSPTKHRDTKSGRNMQRNKPSSKHTNTQIKTQVQHNGVEFSNVDSVSSNVKSLVLAPCFTFFEDNEAVIKMIIKSKSPTMRHVSRTHRIALDWLFDRVNLDPKIQIKFVDTKNQHADILTKSNFTRDEWNHLLRLFNISNFSSASCPQTKSKRIQEVTREERIVAK